MSEELSREVELIRHALEEIRDELRRANDSFEKIIKFLSSLTMPRVK